VQSAKYAFQPGDVLYGKLRPYLDKAVLADDSGICTTELLVLRPKDGVDPRFLIGVVHMPGFVEHAVAGTTGVQHPRTSWNHISEFEVPEFTSDERTKIANLLWKVHDGIIASEAVISAATELKRAAMRTLFTGGLRCEAHKETEIGPVPRSWDVVPLGAHHSVVSGGTPSRTNPTYWTGGTIPWVKTTEVDYCVILETEEHITELGLQESAAKLLPPGTVLLAMYGQGVTRGRVAILGIEAACNQACAAIRPSDAMIDPKYLYHFFSYRYEEIRHLAHGGQQQNLNLDIVRELPIAFPTEKGEQRDIVAILDAIDRKIEVHGTKRKVLEKLFNVVLQGLVSGEIDLANLDFSGLQQLPAEVEA